MPDDIKITVVGLDKVLAALSKFPNQIAKYVAQAGDEAANRVILNERGLKKYPPATSANMPPTPYYIRGKGMQYKTYNTNSSERLGTQWYVKKAGLGTEIGNRASYARYVVGEQQASFMAPKGWRKLYEVAMEKKDKIKAVYQAWINKLIRDLGL